MCVCVCVCVCVRERDGDGKCLGLSLLLAYANQDPFLKWLMLRTPFANIAHSNDFRMAVTQLYLKNRGKAALFAASSCSGTSLNSFPT